MSPIKGISEVVRLQRLGKIRLGIRKESRGISYPESTDYFVCPDEVKKVCGEKPQELRIMFPTENPEQWASQYLRCYSELGRLVCRGNGETAISFSKSGDTTLKEIQCNPASCESYQQGHCRRVMNLQFLLPDCPAFGVYQLDTSSYHSMVNINSNLILIRSLFNKLSMIPLSLYLAKREVQPKGQIKIVQVLVLLPTYSIEKTRKYAQITPEQALVVPPPDTEAPDDLYPVDVLKKESRTKGCQDDLVELWDRVKRKVWHFEMQDYQVADYFEKCWRMDVHLKDFELPLPPEKIKAEHLEGFLRDIKKHTPYS